MKRDEFHITSTAGHSVIKYAWNAAIRETERLARDIARRDNTTYNLTASDSRKVDGYHVSGFRQWSSTDGREIHFAIAKK